MEPVTHCLTGACLSRSGFNRKTAWATLAMVLAAEAPDVDMLWGLRSPVAELQHHRGLTHTLLFAPVMALLVTGLVWILVRLADRLPDRVRPRRAPIPIRWGWLWLGALVADLSHLALDYTTSYGLRPLLPFSGRWHAWSIEYLFDPWLFLALVLALVIPALLALVDQEVGARRPLFRGRGWAIAALVFLLGWWGLRAWEQSQAIGLVSSGGYAGAPLLRVAAEPGMWSPFQWRVLMETAGKYQTAQVDTLTGQVSTSGYDDVVYKPKVTPAVEAAERTYLGRVYLGWSQWPVVEDLGAVRAPGASYAPRPGWHTVEFQDLRFGYAPNQGDRLDAPPDTPLSGWVYIGPGGENEGMFMAGRQQPQP